MTTSKDPWKHYRARSDERKALWKQYHESTDLVEYLQRHLDHPKFGERNRKLLDKHQSILEGVRQELGMMGTDQ